MIRSAQAACEWFHIHEPLRYARDRPGRERSIVLLVAALIGVLAVVGAAFAMRTAGRMEPTRESAPRPDPLLIAGGVNTTVSVVFVATIGPIGLIQTAVGFTLIGIGGVRTRRSHKSYLRPAG